LLSLFSCNTKKDNNEISNIYRFHYGDYKGYDVWVVDGNKIREKIFNEFVYGGNDERYIFVPQNEIWIDNSISVTEFQTTLEHEITERTLMKLSGMTYFDAHDSALKVERKMRIDYQSQSIKFENSLPFVSPIDCDSTQEIDSLPEKIKLKNIYKIFCKEKDSLKIWIVDGFNIRRDIFPDFGFSGNDLAYYFIPKNEIWIDSEISCEEMEYSILLEINERKFISSGKIYDDAYSNALTLVDSLRKQNSKISSEKKILLTKDLIRDKGTGNRN